MFRSQARSRGGESRIDTATVALWRERRDILKTKLARQEQAEWAWLWRTRLSVLEYLIQRYELDLAAGPRQADAERDPRLKHHPSTGESVPESVTPYDHKPTDRISLINDRKRSAIHTRLASLQSANTERHAKAAKAAEALREEIRAWRARRVRFEAQSARLPLQNEPDQTDKLLLAEALRDMDEQAYKKMRQFIAFDLGLLEYTDEPLDDETIRLILLEHDIEPEDSA